MPTRTVIVGVVLVALVVVLAVAFYDSQTHTIITGPRLSASPVPAS